MTLDTALHFPPAGDGVWFIPFNGDVLEANLVAIQGTVEAWTATLRASFGSLQVSGRGGFDGSPIAGTLLMGKETLSFEGAAGEPSHRIAGCCRIRSASSRSSRSRPARAFSWSSSTASAT